jgi:hypothetical protein
VKAWRYALGAVGIAGVLFGLHGLVTGGVATHWPVPVVWLVAGVLVHDLLVVPLVAAAGWVLARAVPAPARAVVRGGLLVAATLTLVALPVLSGEGDATNASLTPLDYPRNYALALAAVLLVTVALAVLRSRRSRPRSGAG